MEMFPDRTGWQTHNSFFQALAELGLAGGTCFLGAFFCAIYGCWRLGCDDVQIADPDLRYLRPYIMAVAVSFSVGLLSLTRVYDVLTYLILGLCAAFLRLATPEASFEDLHLTRRLALRIAAFSGVFVVGFYLFVQFFINRGGG
jgi:hypothetical protein